MSCATARRPIHGDVSRSLGEGRKSADQILTEAAARAEAAGDPVAAFKLRRLAEQAQLAQLRSVQ